MPKFTTGLPDKTAQIEKVSLIMSIYCRKKALLYNDRIVDLV